MGEMIRIPVGLIGFGSASRVFHAPVISATQGLELAAVVERHGDTASRLYPAVRVFRDAASLFDSGAVRLVVVATPNATHFDLARQALLTGHDVVVDKPFTSSYEEGRELSRLASSLARLLSVFQNRRWDGDFLTVRRLIESGILGRVTLFESRFDRYRPARRTSSWRETEGPGAGLLFDLGPHLIDQALVLFGLPEAVTADVRTERDDAVVDDAFDVVLHYPGIRAILRAGMLACDPAPRFRVQGTQGSYTKHGLDPQENALKAGGVPGSPGWGEEDESLWGTLATASAGGLIQKRTVRTEPGNYLRYYANVRDAIVGAAPLGVGPHDGCRVIRILELARESSRLRRTLEVKDEPSHG